MPLDLAGLLAREAVCAVPYAGEVVRVVYRPAAVTGRVQGAIAQAGRDNDFAVLFAEMAAVLVSWDITDGGQPVATTAESLAAVDLLLVMAVVRGVFEDVANPTRAATAPSATRSPNGSSPTASSGAPPTTSASSSTPAGPASPPGPFAGPTTPPPAFVGADGSAA